MPSFTTLYRAIVMVAAGVLVVKGWQLYGPTSEQMHSIGERALDMASAAVNNLQSQPTAAAIASDDPRLTMPTAPTATELPAAAAPVSLIEPVPLLPAAEANENTLADDLPVVTSEPATVEVEGANELPAGTADRLSPLYARLEGLGITDPQLTPWGSSGQMYRFHCRAALTDVPAAARHFEAVAAEPIAAVELVLAKVESWRTLRDKTTAEFR